MPASIQIFLFAFTALLISFGEMGVQAQSLSIGDRSVSYQEAPGPAAGGGELYALVIGSGEYAIHPSRGDLEAAERSADLVGELLRNLGSVHTIVLRSDIIGGSLGHAVTREDILFAVRDLKMRIRADSPQSPRIVFYYMGHGLGNSGYQSISILPGNFPLDYRESENPLVTTLREGVWDMDILMSLFLFRLDSTTRASDGAFVSDWLAPLIDGGDINRLMTAVSEMSPARDSEIVPFVLLFDNCGTEVPETFPIEGQAGIVVSLLRSFPNRGFSLYAAPPGENAFTVPFEPSPSQLDALSYGHIGQVGPLARSLFEFSFGSEVGVPVSFGRAFDILGTPREDLGIERPFSGMGIMRPDVASAILFSGEEHEGSIELRLGTGHP